MNDLEIGDRVRVVDDPTITRPTGYEVMARIEGTVKELSETHVGVEFDYYADVKNNSWNGRLWHIPYDYLEKIEDTEEEPKEEVNEEIKAEALEQKILTALREEIGVEIGEAFDVYENGRKKWMCKFEKSGHLVSYKRGGFEETFIWKYWVFHFDKYVFKKKQFIPKQYYSYHYVKMSYTESGELIFDGIDYAYWGDNAKDIAMLSVGNVFATEREAAANKEKVLGTVNKCLQNVIG